MKGFFKFVFGFVLEPLMEIAPELRHPILNKTIKQLYAELNDTLIVEKI